MERKLCRVRDRVKSFTVQDRIRTDQVPSCSNRWYPPGGVFFAQVLEKNTAMSFTLLTKVNRRCLFEKFVHLRSSLKIAKRWKLKRPSKHHGLSLRCISMLPPHDSNSIDLHLFVCCERKFFFTQAEIDFAKLHFTVEKKIKKFFDANVTYLADSCQTRPEKWFWPIGISGVWVLPCACFCITAVWIGDFGINILLLWTFCMTSTFFGVRIPQNSAFLLRDVFRICCYWLFFEEEIYRSLAGVDYVNKKYDLGPPPTYDNPYNREWE